MGMLQIVKSKKSQQVGKLLGCRGQAAVNILHGVQLDVCDAMCQAVFVRCRSMTRVQREHLVRCHNMPDIVTLVSQQCHPSVPTVSQCHPGVPTEAEQCHGVPNRLIGLRHSVVLIASGWHFSPPSSLS